MIGVTMDERESDISGDGDVFNGESAIERAHVDMRVPRGAPATGRCKAERIGTGRRMGTIWFQGQPPPGPPPDLIGKDLTLRLDDGRSVEFKLFDSGTIQVLRITP